MMSSIIDRVVVLGGEINAAWASGTDDEEARARLRKRGAVKTRTRDQHEELSSSVAWCIFCASVI